MLGFTMAVTLSLAMVSLLTLPGCFLMRKMVRLSGSTTLLPLAQEGADMFMENSPGERVVV
jgi:ABC-type phosphate transport system substrate-binding protein